MRLKSVVRVVAFTSLCCLLTPIARADSDGYYCVGPGYIAYQLRAALTSGTSGHTLRIVRYGADGIRLAGEVTLEDFQPHRMICGESEVRIGGFSSRPVEYVVDVSSDSGPRITHVVSNPQMAGQRTALKNLGAWAPNGMFALPSSDQGSAFHLVTTETEERVGGELLHHKRTELVMSDRQGNVLQRLELFNGQLVETID